MALTPKQRGVLKGIAAALVIVIATGAAAVLWQPAFLAPAADGPAARLAFAVRADLAVVACLVVAIGALARHRFFTPADIDGGGVAVGTDRAQAMQAVVQNTLEQTVLAVLAHMAWAVVAPRAWLALVPAAAALFVIGRVLFWRGYARGAPGRALGFALTFYPSVLLVVAAIPLALS